VRKGWPCVGFGLWNQRWVGAGQCAGIVLCGGRVSVWVSLGEGIGLWPQLLPGQTRVLAKNKAPNFRSLHETKELVSLI